MKIALALTTSLIVGFGAVAAPSVSVATGSVAGNDGFLFTVAPNGETYDTINIVLTATTGSFLNPETNAAVTNFTPAFVTPDTDVLGLNTVAVGLQYVGLTDDTSSLSGAVANLNGSIANEIDIAQAVFAGVGQGGGTYEFRFALNGSEVGEAQTGSFGVPEPGSLALLGLGGLALLRRRR